MKIEEIESGLPNGFHDSGLTRIEIDYVKREITLNIDVNVSNYEISGVSTYRKGVLTVTGFYYFAIDPPCSSYPYQKAEGQWMDSACKVSGLRDSESVLARLPDNIPEKAFVRCFFMFDWNSFIYLAADDAHFKWLSNKIHKPGVVWRVRQLLKRIKPPRLFARSGFLAALLGLRSSARP